MKRSQVLARMNLPVPMQAHMRVIIDTDAKNEADDQFAIIHQLLSPTLDVLGIVASHYESKASIPGETVEKSYQEILKLLSLAEIEDVPVLRGCKMPLADQNAAPDSDGVRFIVEQARSADGPLYIAVQGTMTNVAAALNVAPDIAKKIIILWNGGGPYPAGRPEFNVAQDPEAVRAILASEAEIWQTHQDVYCTLEVTIAELAKRVRPCGRIGQYLFDQLVQQNLDDYNPHFLLRTGENWTLGDNTVVAMMLMNRFRGNWKMRPAPIIQQNLMYQENPVGKMIRVYDSIDVRMTLEDLYCKLELAYGV